MTPAVAGAIGIILMLVLMFCGFNLPFTFIISGVVGIILISGFDLGVTFLQTIPLTSAMSYSLAVLPMFMLMGDFAVTGGLTTDAYGAARKWFGRMPGGLAVTSTVASALFGAICGSGQATAMVMSQVAWPEMKRYGYSPQIGLTSIAAAGPLAILIPPSTPLIMYSILSGASVGSLFMGGWLPGILLTIIPVHSYRRHGKAQAQPGASRRQGHTGREIQVSYQGCPHPDSDYFDDVLHLGRCYHSKRGRWLERGGYSDHHYCQTPGRN